MLRLPADVQAFLQSEARALAPGENVTQARSDTLIAAVVAQSTQATVTETRELIHWLTDLADVPALINAPAGEQDLVLRLGARALSTFAPQLDDTAAALASLTTEDVRDPGSRKRAKLKQVELQNAAHDFIALAAAIGPEAAVDALIAAKLTLESDRDAMTGILAQYVGHASGGRGNWGNILRMFDAFADSPSIRVFLTHVLEVQVYRCLLAHGADDLDLRSEAEHLTTIEHQANACLDTLWERAGLEPEKHPDLRQAVVDTFIAAATMPIPDVFVDSLDDHHGKPKPFPSFAQRVATQRLLTHGDQYLCLPTGRGKTAIPFLAWEIRRRQRGNQENQFLGIYPPNMTRAVANRLTPQPGLGDVQRYYRAGQAPGVGVISEGITPEDCAAALEQPIVLVSDTMLDSVRNGASILESLCAQKRAELTYDELHRANGGGDRSYNAQRLIDTSTYASGTSATPQLNGSLAGIRAAATLFLRQQTADDRWGEHARVRPDLDTSVAEFRSALRRVLFNPEPPSRWSEWFHQCRLRQNPAEVRVMNRITRDRELDAGARHVQAELALLAPWLFAGGDRDDPTLLTHLTREIRQLFAEKPDVHSSLVAVDWLKSGVFVRHHDFPGRESFLERLQDWGTTENERAPMRPLEIHAIWGDTPQRQREQIFAAARTAQERQVTVVILAQRETVNIGIDLRCIDDIRYLGHPTNLAILDQLSGRANRAGRTQVPLTLSYFDETLQAGKRLLAHHRNKEELAVLAPDQPITTRRFRHIYNPGTSPEADVREGRVMRYLEHPDERHERLTQHVHGRGAALVARHLDRAPVWTDWLSHRRNRDQLGSGDANRFVSAFALAERAHLPEALHSRPIVSFGAAGAVLSEDWRRLAPTLEAEIIECHPTERIRQHEQEAVPLATEGTMIRSTSTVMQAPHLRKKMTDAIETLPANLRWGNAGQVVLTGLENFGWSDNEIDERNERQIERGRALIHARRLLPDDGLLTLFLPVTACTYAQFNRLCTEVLPQFGFSVNNNRSGQMSPADTNVAGYQEGGQGGYIISATAVSPEGFRPHWRSLRRVVTPDTLALTPRSGQSESQQNGLRQRRRLPEQFVHREFSVQTRSRSALACRYTHYLPHRAEQEARLAELAGIVRAIRHLAPDPTAWQTPDNRRQQALHNLGAELDASGRYPRFILRSHPEDVFRPYDTLWG